MVIGEHEIKVRGVGGKKGTCLDTFLGDKIGTYACHDPEYRGGTQGFLWLKNRIRTTETVKLCVDANGISPGNPVVMVKCIKDGEPGAKGQHWRYDAGAGHMINQLTELCLDSMRFDKQTYPEAAKNNKHAVFMQPCGKSKGQVMRAQRSHRL